MVELIIVMVLIGILGAVGASRYFSRSSWDAALFAEQTRALLRYAQKTAVARNEPVFVALGANRIALCHVAPNGDCPAANRVMFPGGKIGGAATEAQCGAGNWYCIGRPDGVTYAVPAGMPQFSFDGLGRPMAAGGFGGLSLNIGGAAGEQLAVTVDQETGYVR